MTVCACPLGAVHQGCEHHQEIAQRFLETLNRAPRLGEPTVPLITQHYRPGGYTPQETR